MKRTFRDLHLRSKLILIIVAVSSLAVLTASILFIVNDALKFRRSVKEDLQTLAAMLGNNSRAALTFHDQQAAQETISVVGSNPRILAAYLLTKENTLLASYISKQADAARLKLTPLLKNKTGALDERLLKSMAVDADSFWGWDYVVSPIRFDNEIIGSIVIQSDAKELPSRIQWFISVIVIVMLIDFVLIYVLSSKLQQIISGPIEELSSAMKQVTEKKDYAVRARKQGNDEVGVLMDGFNDMLAQIELHGEEVETYRNYLEAEVSKRTAAAREWRMTFDATKDAIIMLDADDMIVRTNLAATAYLRKPLNETKGASVHQLFEAGGYFSLLAPLKRSRETLKHEEDEIHIADRSMWFVVSANPISKEQARSSGTVLILRDISDRKRAEDAHKELHAQLIQFQKMDSIGRLAGGIAHDFNNILSSIIGYSELALMKLPHDHPVSKDIQIIFDAGKRAAMLTRQLLAFSRKQVLEMAPINLNTVVGNTVKLFSRLLGEHIILIQELQTPISNIVADVGQMEQVIMNLMVNARDAMPDGGRLTIKTAEAGSSVILSVTDTGTGITKEVQERMFEPFFTTKERGKGTGLGLATVYGIVDQHNGHIKVDSELGRGTTFTIHLPITDRRVNEVEQQKTAAMVRGTETILVVDDEPSIHRLICNVLQPLGYRVLEASGGEEALKISRDCSEPIDLLLTDVVMPGMNGPTLAETLGRERPGIKVIFMSGYIDEAITARELANPDLVLLQKPLTAHILSNKVREVLDKDKNTASPAKDVKADLSALRILYADDDDAVRRLVANILGPSRCELVTCENGRLAVEMFQAGSFDLVLLDKQMPVMDGPAAARAIRSWEAAQGRKPISIIALTGSDGMSEVNSFLDAGCTAHLTKPISRNVLLGTIGRYAPSRPSGGTDAGVKTVTDTVFVTIDQALKILMPDYLQKMREDARSIGDALERLDYETIRILGHSMKGSGGGYGLDAVTDFGMNIETAAKERSPEKVRISVAGLQRYLDRVVLRYE